MVNLLSFMLGIVNFGSFHVGGFSCFDGASVEFLPFRNQQSSGKQARDQHSAGHVYSINGTYKDKRRLTSLSSGSMSIDQPTTGVLRYDGVRSAASLRGSPFSSVRSVGPSPGPRRAPSVFSAPSSYSVPLCPSLPQIGR